MVEATYLPETGARAEPLHIAVVSDRSEVLWISAAATREEVARELSEFLLPRAAYQLHEEDAGQFRRLVEQDQRERAIELYFASVGERWDAERLTLVTRTIGARTGGDPRGAPERQEYPA